MRPMICVLLTLTVASSVWGVAPPKAEQSEYLTSGLPGFACSPNSLIYLASFEVRKKNLTSPRYAVVRFENPADPTTPLEAMATISVGDKELKAKSPALPFVKAEKVYSIDVTLFSDEVHSHVVGGPPRFQSSNYCSRYEIWLQRSASRGPTHSADRRTHGHGRTNIDCDGRGIPVKR